MSLTVWSLTLLQKLGSFFLAVFPATKEAENSENLISCQTKADGVCLPGSSLPR